MTPKVGDKFILVTTSGKDYLHFKVKSIGECIEIEYTREDKKVFGAKIEYETWGCLNLVKQE